MCWARAWPTGRAPRPCSRAAAPYVAARRCCRRPLSLPPAERRRAGRVIKLALAVGFEATARAGYRCAHICRRYSAPPAAMATIATRSARRWRAPIGRSRRRDFTTRCTTSPPAIGASPPAPRRAANVLCASRRELRRGAARSLDAGRGRAHTGAAVGLRYAVSATTACSKRPIPDAFGVALVCSRRARATLAKLTAALTEQRRRPHG